MTDVPTTRGPGSSQGGPDRGGILIDNVTQRFATRQGPHTALEGINLNVTPGEFVAIVGPSGCGKSTLLRLVAGFDSVSVGSISIDGVPVSGPGPDRGFVFQQPRLLPWLSVKDNVGLGPRFEGVDAAQRNERAREALAMVGLADQADRPPYELSGGMQQRVAIARALAARPRILLLDEPFAALDALTREQLQDELARLWETTGTTTLFVTHSVDEAAYLGTRVVALSRGPGRIVADTEISLGSQRNREHLRSTPEFIAVRDEIHRVVVEAARS